MSSANEDGLYQDIQENPEDRAPKLVLADWLQIEKGDDTRAEIIRLLDAYSSDVPHAEGAAIARRLYHLIPTKISSHVTVRAEDVDRLLQEHQRSLQSVKVTEVPADTQEIEELLSRLRAFPFLTHVELVLDANNLDILQSLAEGFFARLLRHFPCLELSFLNGRRILDWTEIGTDTAKQLEQDLDTTDLFTGDPLFQVSDFARALMHNEERFVRPVNRRSATPEILHLLRLRVRDLGFTEPPTTTELFARARKFGLELCPPETALLLRLENNDQPSGWDYVGMESVTDPLDRPGIFRIGRAAYDNTRLLGGHYASPRTLWNLDQQVIFRLCKPCLPAGRSDS